MCLERKVVYLEDLTSPPLPLSSSCSLLSGGTRGAGLNYGEEVECDTDAGRGNSVSKARTEQDMPQSLLPHPETMRAIANHLLPLPSQQSWAHGQVVLSVRVCESCFFQPPPLLLYRHFNISPTGAHMLTHLPLRKMGHSGSGESKNIYKLN